jgi:uncharacterized Tic20 family protein
MGGTEHAIGITKVELSVKLNQHDVEDASFMKVKAIVTKTKSYDVLVRSTILLQWVSLWTSRKKQQIIDQDGKQMIGARSSYQLGLFEFSLVTLLICMLSLAL